jgi:hypothetical protein
MKRELEPTWSDEQLAAGKRTRDAWEQFFSGTQQAQAPGRPGMRPEELRVAQVRARRERELLRYPNVVGVSIGSRVHQGTPTEEPCLVVYVERKLSPDQLAPGELLPAEVEGVRVDVVETGAIQALPS